MDIKLKPCPFCGGEHIRIMNMGYPHWVVCMDCGAQIQGGTTDEKDSIDAWNRRESNWMERNKERILQAGMEGREVEFWIGGRLFAVREKAQ